MRLDQDQILIICQSFRKYFGKEDHLWLFGSRVDDAKKGGDIDLYVETTYSPSDAVSAKLDFLVDVKMGLGDQKIDVILNLVHSNIELPIYKVAQREGIQLA
jgi:hypothetical protein